MPARISPKENSGANGKFLPKPLLFHLRHPNSKTNQPKFWQILSSPKNSFAKTSSVLKPRHTARILGGQNPERKTPFLFQKKFPPRQIRNARSVFSFGVAGVLASAWGFRGAYDSIQSHHALRAWHISDFGNRCELDTIETPGKEYTDEDYEKALKSRVSNIDFKKLDFAEITKLASQKIADNKVIGWFQGKSEMGPRALGNRSILANPANKDMKGIINARVKHCPEPPSRTPNF